MRLFHALLAVSVAIIWGLNFLFIKFALQDLPPLLLCTLRFVLVSIPAVFFIKKPAVSWKLLVGYSLFTFSLQFAFLFAGMAAGLPPGITSLVVQTQVFFSLFFAFAFLGERLKAIQILSVLIAFSGIGLVWFKMNQTTTLAGLCLCIASATSWGLGNALTKKIGRVDGLALVIWGSFLAIFPLLTLSLMVEGSNVIVSSLQHLHWISIISVLYTAYISTWYGYGVWTWLLNQYVMGTVTPFILLVPFVGMLSSMIVFAEPLQSWKIIAGILVVFGVFLNIIAPRVYSRWQQRALAPIVADT